MATRIVEWQLPYTAWEWIEITANKVIKLLLRESNNLILINDDNEAYVDLQLADWITPTDTFPAWVTVWRVLDSDGWYVSWTMLNFQTISWDYGRWIYGTNWHIYYDAGTWIWQQIYTAPEVDALFAQLRSELATVAFTWDYNDLINRPVIPVIWDWTLTVTQNGTTAWTFTANQLTNETIALTDTTYPAMTAWELWTGTDTTQRVISAKVLSDYVLWKVDSALIRKWSVADYDHLPSTDLTVWDVYNVVAEHTTAPKFIAWSDVVWTGTLWEALWWNLDLSTLQPLLISWTNIKTINNTTILGSWNINTPVTTVEDNLTSTSTTNALSANQWRILEWKIEDLQALGKFLSLWDCETWLPISFPQDVPYSYSTWDYFLVETVWTTNYRPTGSSYTWTASTTLETEEVEVWDLYIYDGSTWLLQLNHGKTVSFANLTWQPSDNTALANALWDKQDNLVSGTNIKTINWNSILWSWNIETPNTTYSAATTSNLWLIKLWSDTVQSVAPNSASSTANRTYPVQLNSSNQAVVNVPRTDTTTSSATSSTSGTIKLASDTVQTESAQAVSSTASRTYWVQVNSSWQAVVNVPRTDHTYTVNNATISITQAWTAKWDFTTNQWTAETIALNGNILATQTVYDGLPSSKTSDWNFYFIYSS